MAAVMWGLSLFALPAQAQYGGGSGTPEDPYQIWDANHMQAIGANPLDWGKHFKLMADIDLSIFTGTSFNIIGTESRPFTGVFDGNGHTISNFSYTSTGTSYIGLFGDVKGATIKKLGLIYPNVDAGTGGLVGSLVGHLEDGTITECYVEGGSVSGDRFVGGLVGVNGSCALWGGSSSTIANCYSTASVSGDWYVGGLVGLNGSCAPWGWCSSSTITNCYSTCSVSGNYCVGGLVGSNSGSVLNCYSTSSVTGKYDRVGGLVGTNEYGKITNCYSTGSASGGEFVGGLVGGNFDGYITYCYSTGSVDGNDYLGGLVGFNDGGMVTYSFWDIETSGQTTSAGGWGKTTAQMQTASTFYAWACVDDFAWTIDEGNDYPRLVWENKLGELITIPPGLYRGGTGEPNDPYLIYTAEQLNTIGLVPCHFDKHFKLMADIDLSGFTGTSFNIIGSGWKYFSGVFDGNGHTISNFSYTSTGTEYIGLFGYVSGENAVIRDLAFIDPNVDAGSGHYVGSLVGLLSNGTVTNCYAEGGSICGKGGVGGLVGYNSGKIIDCYSTGSISGYADIGGLVGRNYDGAISNCYSTGSVVGDEYVGGLVGGNGNGGTITNCYSTSSVSGTGWQVGGLVGWNSGTITDCYSTSSVSGGSLVGGLVGYNPGTITGCYSTGSVSGDSRVGGLVGRNGGLITDCYVTGSVKGENDVGGLVGSNWEGTITNCYSTCSVSGDRYVGGLVGWNYFGTITSSYSTGSVSGVEDVGGLVGRNGTSWGEGAITNCYSTASVSGQDYVGGLVGFNEEGTITNCYSTGSVSGQSQVGGLVGRHLYGEVTASFWDIETSRRTTSAGGIGRTTAQMMQQSTFTDWDFENVWDICEGSGYPRLWWEPPLPVTYAGPDQYFVNVIPHIVILDGSSSCNVLSYHWNQVAGPVVTLDCANEPIAQFIPTEFGVYVFELIASNDKGENADKIIVYIEERYAGGTGTPEDAFQIQTTEQMNEIGLYPEDWDKHFLLMADIDLIGFTGTSFNIIGNFTGVFDGNDHTISNFSSYRGLFGSVSGEIKDLGLIDPTINAGTGSSVGSLVGSLNNGTITNCYVEGGSVEGLFVVGGLVGINYGTVTNCYSSNSVSGIAEVGGLVGRNFGTITNCYSSDSVSGIGEVGGLVGENEGTITNCCSSGSILGEGWYVGGLVGENYGIITNCYSAASVTGDSHVGGLVGGNWDTITNCYSTASVTGDDCVGGLAGLNSGVITNCYSIGSVTGGYSVGGLVGQNVSCYSPWGCYEGEIWNSFWDIETSGQTTSAGGTGLSTNQMQIMSNFTDAGWDFVGETFNSIEDIWFIPQQDYPHLWWEGMQVPMKLTPRTLNCRSEGNWVKAHITLPQGFTVADVDPDKPAVLHSFGFESAPLYVFVNKDKLVQIEAAFEREAVCSLAGDWPEALTVAGFLTDGNIFLGRSPVRIIHPGMKVIEELANCWLQGDCVHPTWCDGIDMNRDSLVNLLDYALLMSINVEFVSE